jgi:hypothetical protein
MLNDAPIPEQPIKFECVSSLSKPELWQPFTNVHDTLFKTPNLCVYKPLRLNSES